MLPSSAYALSPDRDSSPYYIGVVGVVLWRFNSHRVVPVPIQKDVQLADGSLRRYYRGTRTRWEFGWTQARDRYSARYWWMNGVEEFTPRLMELTGTTDDPSGGAGPRRNGPLFGDSVNTRLPLFLTRIGNPEGANYEDLDAGDPRPVFVESCAFEAIPGQADVRHRVSLSLVSATPVR